MHYTTLKVQQESKITTLTISRPESLNALNTLFFKELNLFLDSFDSIQESHVLIITGDGKAFAAGADISEMKSMGSEEAIKLSRNGQMIFSRLENLQIPVIAALNGYALGGGFELAMACDFRIASVHAKFGLPEASLGLMPGYGGTQKLSRLSGLGNALYMLLTGEIIDADEALRMGIVQKVTKAENLISEARLIAEKILSNGPNAIKAIKEVSHKGYKLDLSDGLSLEQQEFSKLFESDGPEGMKAFLEKRKPKW